MRYFYDTEFIEDGETIELVSIGIVGEDGSEYYAVSTEFHPERANAWVRENVLQQLPSPCDSVWKSRRTIREDVYAFLNKHSTPVELWAWVGAYDHVVIAQLWGDMKSLPKRLPRYTRELKQYWEFAGRPALPEVPRGNHDALVDARHNLAKFKVCAAALPLEKGNRVSKTCLNSYN
ncbi:polyadenylate-specific 3'-exoribonuclease AS [Corynebacterium flavescens]|uniref:polyadenylate-specific 3'-exoribonuclease AS n=1 Tax=Corynebacterium flavescens TaxID=28028 RepID=UPI00257E7EC9|nr:MULTISPECIES: polyadenylate-specific 3'-exoribonuclease AS [Corynebacterium]MDN6431315.1 polyadenylate-specific 3'-exoribonuclease AS [Corynebacterium flavescens]MDN6475468.1 polyadenylate-specific 3'-exoribonuclease AS [Corynebacterium flavescens]MDN6531184.1 polyadenylate-specific 3'-exoribonuclease AS [Corynebacterium flavescens]MDN6600545.1 polyadenylate-specific 3'-exoribonuclease AS [Corynebacterium flavescens]MDN6822441.1 polyadenylate-specific 3'-exoribonuclease AS [Corynebacterium 